MSGIRIIIKPQKGSQELAMNIKADLIIYGGSAGSGKSHLILMKSLPYLNDPNYHASYFRKNTKQITQQGGIWEESKKLYSHFKPKTNNTDLKHTFKSGATIAFNHLEHEKHKESYQGGQLSAAFFDELTHFSETQFTYILSRLRSDAEVDGFAMATCNPSYDSWVLEWVKWWLDEEGYPDKEKQGIVRYYVLIDEKPIFADSAKELKDLYPEAFKIWNPKIEDYIEIEPKTFTFIAGTIFDNPILIQKNPRYLAELNSLPRVEKARLLNGCWYAIPEASGYFKREWLNKVDSIPLKAKICRAWDKAASEPSEVERFPDFTACIKMYKDREGRYYLSGEFCNSNFDKTDPNYKGRFRRRAGDRDKIILDQAEWDGPECYQIMPIDPGAAGKVQPNHSKVLTKYGFKNMSDINIGDYILNPDGSNQKVINKFPHKDWNFYKVTFNDGSSCEVGKEHLWVSWRADTKTTRGKSLKKLQGNDPFSLWPPYAEVITTEGIMKWLEDGYTPLIPLTKPLNFVGGFGKDKQIDPYLLGLLLGDGCLTCSYNNWLRFACADNELIEYIRESGYIIKRDGNTANWFFNRNDESKSLFDNLSNLKLIGTNSKTKFIPKYFLNSSLDSRIALLQGMMDTDGYVDDKGKYEYVTVSKQLSDDFQYLVRSLGGWTQITEKDDGDLNHSLVYRHYVRLPNEILPFRLTRKLGRLSDNSGRLFRRVVSIEYSCNTDGTCLLVNNPNHLYITDDFIVTHNCEFQESAKKLIEEGFVVKQDPSPNNRSKLIKFTPFASACENGLVYIVENTFDKKTLDEYYRELETFDGERSTRTRKDD